MSARKIETKMVVLMITKRMFLDIQKVDNVKGIYPQGVRELRKVIISTRGGEGVTRQVTDEKVEGNRER